MVKFTVDGSRNTYKRYNTVLNKLEDYAGESLKFIEITVTFLSGLEKYLIQRGNAVNTRYSNLKVIRTILYQAIREGRFPQEKNPFFKFKLKRERPNKEKLTETGMDQIRDLNLQNGSFTWDTKNFFLASFNLYGMRFSDLCRLTGDNIYGGRINYTMRKTGRKMSIGITRELDSIICKYHDSLMIDDTTYLFPLLTGTYETEKEELQAISSRNAQVNSYLTKIAKKAGIKKNISTHIARHTFADITRKKGIYVYDISKMMGHSSVKQTETYLATLDSDSMDEAAKVVYG